MHLNLRIGNIVATDKKVTTMQSFRISTDADALLTETQAADVLNLSLRTLQVWRSNHAGPSFVRAGRAIRYRRRDICAWIDANTVSNSTGMGARHEIRIPQR